MLIGVTLRHLTHRLGGRIHDKNMQALIVVEARHSFASIRLVEVARDHHGIAAGFRSFSAGSRGDECDLLAVGRPGEILASAWQRTVRSSKRGEKRDVRAVRFRYEQSAFFALMPLKREPFAIRRPQWTAAG